MVNFGVGLGAFMDGAQRSYRQANELRQTFENGQTDRRMRRVEREQRANADAAREADISKGITTNVDPNTGATTFKVGQTDYGTDSAAARKAAEQQVGSFTDYYMKTAVPALVDGYMRAGRPEMAQQYQTWMETAGAKRGLTHWATAARAAQRGDTSQFLKSMQAAYNTRGYYDDGVEATGGEELKDKDGNVTGIRMDFKGADGRTYSRTYEGMEDVYRAGVMMMAPEQVFQSGMADVKAGQAARADAAKVRADLNNDLAKQNNKAVLDDRINDRQSRRQLGRDAAQHGYRMEEDANAAQVRAAYGSSGPNGETEGDIRKQLETISKRMAETDLGWSKLTPEEQNARAVAELQRQRESARGIFNESGSNAVAAPGRTPSLY
ncbi:MAG: hypothetical protein VYD90_10705 [Pseudomonadota bacterium]|nr:hypothetical protein [Pseudomonadota bacterium]